MPHLADLLVQVTDQNRRVAGIEVVKFLNQDFFDNRYTTMVLMIYKNPNPGDSGHIAFVGNSNLTMFSVPTIPGLEGKKGTTLQSHQLVLVQAGTNTGVTSINYGTNKWYDEKNRQNLLKNNVYFYTVRGK